MLWIQSFAECEGEIVKFSFERATIDAASATAVFVIRIKSI